MESKKFLTEQIITYIGNKRSLLDFIEEPIKIVLQELSKNKIDTLDLFSGSGIVARYLKQYSRVLHTNDLESYSKTVNACYLMNRSEINISQLKEYHNMIINRIIEQGMKPGFISRLYSPKDDNNIQKGERVFFTRRNALYIDTVRQLLEEVPEPYKTMLLGPLIYEASNKNNTSGVFKGFYKNSETKLGQFGGNGKNALKRILADITLELPVLSKFECDVNVYQEDANILVETLPKVDLAYLDPPYNQHPYGSNYFMLNLINDYIEPKSISEVSGIPKNWNKSKYNSKKSAIESMEDLCNKINAKYVLISFNSEGFITKDNMIDILSKQGEVRVYEKKYNTFRASRNLKNRDMHVKEYLFLLKKGC
jgi:adenine-specific DNA-methyltransferase